MPSFTYRCIEKVIRIAKIKKYYQMNPEEILAFYEKRLKQQKADPPKKVRKQLNVKELQISSHLCYKVYPEHAKKRAVLFVHGGGYIMEINNLHWSAIQKIAQQKESVVYVPIYPLAPNYDCMETFQMIKALYTNMLTAYGKDNITVIGDSAGAQIILSFCQQCLRENLPQPKKIILVSPPVDFAPDEATSKRYDELEPSDPMIAKGIIPFVKSFWAGSYDMADYHISPIYGEFKGLAPIEAYCGTKEILYATIHNLEKKVKEANGIIHLHIGEDMIHIWPYYLWSKESKEALQNILNAIE